MDYKEKYNKLVEAVKVLQKTNPSDEGIQNWVNDNVPELAESEDEKIRKRIMLCLEECVHSDIIRDYEKDECISWLEKQGTPNQVSIWKHWKDGIAGNGEGKQIYLIKSGDSYILSSCLGYECNYIELSELDRLLEKQGEQKSAWSEEDSMIQNGIILDGVVYELTTGFPDNKLSLCGNCELREKCMELSDGSPCYFFADSFRKVFRKVKMRRKL